ncbi:MAG: PaaI family thioesterase [Vicinamibacterales bacterium]
MWPFPSPADSPSFVSGDPASSRIRIAYFRKPDDRHLFARVWFGPGAEGPPLHAHGGAMAAVLDEAMGGVCWMNDYQVLAARLSVTFLRPLPLDTHTTVEAWIVSVDGRKVSPRARLLDASGQVVAEGEGLFIVMKEDYLTAR